jgi:hypothetical protein
MGRVLAGLTALSHALATAFGGAPSIAATVGLSGIAIGVLLFHLPLGAAACSMPVAVGGDICVTERQTARRQNRGLAAGTARCLQQSKK